MQESHQTNRGDTVVLVENLFKKYRKVIKPTSSSNGDFAVDANDILHLEGSADLFQAVDRKPYLPKFYSYTKGTTDSTLSCLQFNFINFRNSFPKFS